MLEFYFKRGVMYPDEVAQALGLVEGDSPQGLITYLDREDGKPVGFTADGDFLVIYSEEASEELLACVHAIASPAEA
jgi:hypothetical protein